MTREELEKLIGHKPMWQSAPEIIKASFCARLEGFDWKITPSLQLNTTPGMVVAFSMYWAGWIDAPQAQQELNL